MVLELFAGGVMALGIGVLVVSRYLLAGARREIARVRELHARLCGTDVRDRDGRFEVGWLPGFGPWTEVIHGVAVTGFAVVGAVCAATLALQVYRYALTGLVIPTVTDEGLECGGVSFLWADITGFSIQDERACLLSRKYPSGGVKFTVGTCYFVGRDLQREKYRNGYPVEYCLMDRIAFELQRLQLFASS